MKTTQHTLPFQCVPDIHPQYEIRSVKSMQNLPFDLNQNFHHNTKSHLTYHDENPRKKKNKQTISPILQPQQPQNYLNQEFGGTKQVSLTSCRSQPLKVTRRKTSSQHQIHLFMNSKQFPQRLPKNQTSTTMNDNKRIGKQLSQPNKDFPLQKDPNPYKQYFQQRKFHKDHRTARNNFNHNDEHQNNQQTLRRNDKKCLHKSKSKHKLQKAVSMQNLTSRLNMCEAYIELGDRKASLLAQEVDYLLRKQHQRLQRKMRSRQHKHHKHIHKEHKHYDNDYGYDMNVKGNDNVENVQYGKSKQVSLMKKKKNRKPIQSPGKFHYRSCDNRQSSSRMRQLIYFHENDQSLVSNNKPKINKKKVINKEQLDHIKHSPINNNKKQQTNQQTSIYYQVQFPNNRKTSLSIRNTQRPFKNHEQRPLVYSNLRVQNTQSYLDHAPQPHIQNIIKSDKQPYDDSSQYLLQEYQNDTLRQTKQYNVSHNTLQKSQFNEVNFSYVHSQHLASQNYCSEGQRYGQESYNQENEYLTRGFQISQDHGMNTKRLTFSKRPKQESYISNHSSIKSSKSRKVGHFTQGSIIYEPQDFTSQINQKQNLNLMQSNKRPINSHHDSQKSGKQASQKQYTFINHDSNRKNSSSAHFQVIQSNINSPQHFDYIISSNDNTQTQLIRQFDELVIAAAEEATPMKKKLIRKQIYRTSQQIKRIKSSSDNHQNNPKMTRSIQHK